MAIRLLVTTVGFGLLPLLLGLWLSAWVSGLVGFDVVWIWCWGVCVVV